MSNLALEEGMKIFVQAIEDTQPRKIAVKYRHTDTIVEIFEADPETGPAPGKVIRFREPSKPYDSSAPIGVLPF